MKTLKKVRLLLIPVVIIFYLVNCSTGYSQNKKDIITSTDWVFVGSFEADTKKDVTLDYKDFAGYGSYKNQGTFAFKNFYTAKVGEGNWMLVEGDSKIKLTFPSGYVTFAELYRVDKTHLEFKVKVPTQNNTFRDLIIKHVPFGIDK